MPPRPLAPLTGPDAWRGVELAATPAAWQRPLTTNELAALDDAAARLIAAGWPASPDEAVGSPVIAAQLATLRHELLDELLSGRGFAVLRGLPVEDDPARVAARLWVLGRHLGAPVSQNARGHLLGHVCDLG